MRASSDGRCAPCLRIADLGIAGPQEGILPRKALCKSASGDSQRASLEDPKIKIAIDISFMFERLQTSKLVCAIQRSISAA